jgi:hypothetical protein
VGHVVLDAINDGEDAVFMPRSLNEVLMFKRGAVVGGTGNSSTAPPGTRCSTMKSVAMAETLSQESLISSKLTGVARKFTGAAGKTVAEEVSSENTGSSCSDAAPTRYMKVTPSCKPRDLSVAPVAETSSRSVEAIGSNWPSSSARSI